MSSRALDLSFMLMRARAQWHRGRDVFNRRPTRERVLLMAVMAALLAMAADRLWLDAGFKRWQAATRAERQTQDLLAQAQAEAGRIESDRQASAQTQARQLRELQARAIARQNSAGTSALVPADQMLPLLERLLRQQGQLKLKGLQSLGKTEVGGNIYRHGVELSLEGSYGDLLAYLEELEALPEHLLWGQVQLKVEQYPRVQLSLRVYTLSADLDWFKL